MDGGTTITTGLAATVERGELLAALTPLLRAVEARATIPILSHVHISVMPGNRLRLVATDLDREASATLPAAGCVIGECTTHLQTMVKLVKSLPAGADVRLWMQGERLRVDCGRMSARLFVLPVADFPQMPHAGFERKFELAADVLRGLIDRTRFAISTEETRYYLNGIFLHQHDADLVAAATDGHRLAQVTTPMPDGALGMPAVIIPRATVALLRDILGRDAAPVAVWIGETRVRFSVGVFTVESKLVDGTYPEYAPVIPSMSSRKVTVGRKAMLAALARVTAVSGFRMQRVNLTVSPGSMAIESQWADLGVVTDAIDATVSCRELSSISFNAHYLRHALAVIGGDVEFHFEEPYSPTLIRDTADARLRIVLMPMRI